MSDDLIKRSDAIGAFVAETNGVDVEKAIKVVDAYLQIRECDEVWDSIRAIRDCLECAKDEIAEYIPSADSLQGEWIGESDGYADGEPVYDTWYCSNCDYTVDDDEPPTWNYCPHCGAMMKGANNETEMF